MKLRCLFGHKYKVLLTDEDSYLAKMHLHPLAGRLARCERCGKIWDDCPRVPDIVKQDRINDETKIGI